MYNLGEHFNIDLNSVLANPDCIFKGAKYRITVLTERLIRLEYSEKGIFNDYPTLLIQNRKFERPVFEKKEDNSYLYIITKYFTLKYLKESNFSSGKVNPDKNLSISLNSTKKVWYYNHPEARNFGYVSSILSGNLKKSKSLCSFDGFSSIDDSLNDIIISNGQIHKKVNPSIDVYAFFYDKDYFLALNDYSKLIGGFRLLPRSYYGLWYFKNKVYYEKDILKIVKKFEEYNVPISNFILGNWESNIKYGLSNQYKEFTKLVSYLKQSRVNISLVMDLIDNLNNSVNNYELLKQYVPIDKNGNCVLDVYNPKIVDAYLKILVHSLNSLGISNYYINYNKFDKSIPITYYLYKDILRNTRNIPIGYNYNNIVHNKSILYLGYDEIGWNSLKNMIKANVLAPNMGLSYICYDVAGFKDGFEDGELFTRAIQCATFLPIFKLGSDASEFNKKEPWKWDTSTEKITTDFINLRYKLIPIIYSESYKYYLDGKPLIEPIYYRYSDLYFDSLFNDNYFFANTFYVCPILEKSQKLISRTIHKIFIPDGLWFDYFTGKLFRGKKEYTMFYKDNEYPVFVKSGSIVPLSLNDYNDVSNSKKLEIQVFPLESSKYSLYEDDGISNSYLGGECAITDIEYNYKENEYSLIIYPTKGNRSLIPETRDYKICFKNTFFDSIVEVRAGNNRADYKKYKNDFDLIIEFNNINTFNQITVVCKKDKLVIDNLNVMKDDIVSIISDLPIKTVVKEKINNIMFSNLLYTKKRIQIRKLANGNNYIERKYIDLLLKLLEYINEV